MMAPRDLISGAIFQQSPQSKDQIISDLQAELNRKGALLMDLRWKLAEAQSELERMKREKILREDAYPPTGDEKHGYCCGVCCMEIDYPFEQNYCGSCGKRIDWNGYIAPPDRFEPLDRLYPC